MKAIVFSDLVDSFLENIINQPNYFIWGKGRDKTLAIKPYHLTRTTSY